MLYLLGGFAVLSGFLLLVYLFVNADPARLARGLKVTGIVIAVAAVATLAISGRLAALLMPLAMLMPLLIRVRHILDRYRPPAGGQTSTVATAFLRMTLDHDTGSMEGTILRGRFAGMRLDELGSADLLALLRECRAGRAAWHRGRYRVFHADGPPHPQYSGNCRCGADGRNCRFPVHRDGRRRSA